MCGRRMADPAALDVDILLGKSFVLMANLFAAQLWLVTQCIDTCSEDQTFSGAAPNCEVSIHNNISKVIYNTLSPSSRASILLLKSQVSSRMCQWRWAWSTGWRCTESRPELLPARLGASTGGVLVICNGHKRWRSVAVMLWCYDASVTPLPIRRRTLTGTTLPTFDRFPTCISFPRF